MLGSATFNDQIARFHRDFVLLADNVEKVVYGKREVICHALICLFARGHLLIEDVPGVAKTSLARALADSIEGGTIRRIQFTPDLLPSDVIGVPVFDQRSLEFTFRKGPVFANIVLGDEINRASPKTQSALLEVMAERQVTVNGDSYVAPEPFLCVATQNPIEHHGTFPLPEAQLDRFMMRIGVGYPLEADEARVLTDRANGKGVGGLRPVLTVRDLRELMGIASNVAVVGELSRYVVAIANETRGEFGARRGLRLGVSPRGCLALMAAAQALAAARGRSYATSGDVKAMAVPVLSHRLLLALGTAAERRTQAQVIEEILADVKAPDG